MPSLPSARRGEPLERRCRAGAFVDARYFQGLDTVALPILPPDSAASRHGPKRIPFKRWFSRHPVVLDTAASDTAFLLVEKLESVKSGADWPRTDAGYLLIRRGIIEAVKPDRVFALPDSNLASESERRALVLPQGEGRNILLVRSERAPGKPGEERYEAFGIRRGVLKEFSGGLMFARDNDFPPSLEDGQVFYGHVPHSGFRFLVPITLDLNHWKFVPEFGDDAVFSAAGEGRARLEGSQMLTMPIYLHPRLTSVQRTITVRPDSRIQAVRFYGPWVVFRKGDRRFDLQDWLQVRVDSLQGWIPAGLYRYVGFGGTD